MSQEHQETEEVPVSQVPQDQWVPQDLLEDLDGMACQDYQVPKETWVPWELQDLVEDLVALEDQVLQDLKVNPDSQVEMARPAAPVLRERGVTLAPRDLQDPPSQQWPSREPKETQEYQVYQVFQVRKVLLVSQVTLDCQDQMDVLDFPDHQVLREILASQEAQVVPVLQD